MTVGLPGEWLNSTAKSWWNSDRNFDPETDAWFWLIFSTILEYITLVHWTSILSHREHKRSQSVVQTWSWEQSDFRKAEVNDWESWHWLEFFLLFPLCSGRVLSTLHTKYWLTITWSIKVKTIFWTFCSVAYFYLYFTCRRFASLLNLRL